MTQKEPNPGIIRAIEFFGSQQKLVAAIGRFSQQTISRVLNGDTLSPELAAAIHKATDGVIPKWDLRPDLFDVPARVSESA